MNSITATYPGFQALPKGLKRLLVVSESMFFDQAGVSAAMVGCSGPQKVRGHFAVKPLIFPGAALRDGHAEVEPNGGRQLREFLD
jgi:hypothetical protein